MKQPSLVCGDGTCISPSEEYKTFAHGFYQKPKKKIWIAYLYPRGEYELFKQVANDKRAYLVTTLMAHKKGSPNPLLIEKSCGNISMVNAVTQILYLTQLHVGSMNKMRLPITTGYADKICKNLDYVPTGQVENKLSFPYHMSNIHHKNENLPQFYVA